MFERYPGHLSVILGFAEDLHHQAIEQSYTMTFGSLSTLQG